MSTTVDLLRPDSRGEDWTESLLGFFQQEEDLSKMGPQEAETSICTGTPFRESNAFIRKNFFEKSVGIDHKTSRSIIRMQGLN